MSDQNQKAGHQTVEEDRGNHHAIIPKGSVTGSALLSVIAIMSFLASLTLGAVLLVADTARGWQRDISREITIQVRPLDDTDIRKSLQDARRIAGAARGVLAVELLQGDEATALLEPWLGDGLDLDELPVPRLLAVTIDENDPPDIDALRARLKLEVPGAGLDDHRAWVDRLTTMARTMILVGITVFAMVALATLLIVMFATRGAMAGNRHVIEVLHFVGAEQTYIARQFQGHFFKLGLKGALIGGAAALLVFALGSRWLQVSRQDPSADQVSALFGTFSLGYGAYIGMLGLIVAIALLTAWTSRFTVLRHVGGLDSRIQQDSDGA